MKKRINYFLLIVLLFLSPACKKNTNSGTGNNNNNKNTNNTTYSFIGAWGLTNITGACMSVPYIETVAFLSGGNAAVTDLNYVSGPCQMDSPINFTWTATASTISVTKSQTTGNTLIPGEVFQNILTQMSNGQTFTCAYNCTGDTLSITINTLSGNRTSRYVRQ